MISMKSKSDVIIYQTDEWRTHIDGNVKMKQYSSLLIK